MPAQYSATDSNSGLEVTVTGEFPEETDDRVRIARTTNLFTRLMATILSTESTDEKNQPMIIRAKNPNQKRQRITQHQRIACSIINNFYILFLSS